MLPHARGPPPEIASLMKPVRDLRPAAGGLTRHVALRLDPALIARIDALIPLLSTEWRKARRSDVLRKVILSGLPVLEETRPRRAAPRKAGGKKR